MSFNVTKLREDFPILFTSVQGQSLIYLDNAATTQKPKKVMDSISNYYTHFNANVHRGIHTLSQEATELMEASREKIRSFLNAEKSHEIIFTRGTTESINLVAYGMRSLLKTGDEIIISQLEHHSNIVPWQMTAQHTGAKLKYIPMQESGALDMEAYKNLLSAKTKIVSVGYVSNALGTINPVKEIIDLAHKAGAWVLIDGAQSAPHFSVNMQSLDADFYAFSGHKMYGPTGVGILYGKEKILDLLPPYMGGGEMIKEVNMEESSYADLPFKFEAGTPNIAGNIVLGDAIDYINTYGLDNFSIYEQALLSYAKSKLKEINELIIYADSIPTSGAISFNLNVKGVHPSDVGFILDKQGIAVRTGHHCAQPIMQFYKIPGTVRVSFAAYNTHKEIDSFLSALKKAIVMLS